VANDVVSTPRPEAVRDLRDVLRAQQAALPAGAGSPPVPAPAQQPETLARDILALVQSEIDMQVEWRVQQAVERLRAEGLSRQTQHAVEPLPVVRAAQSIPMLIFSIPIIAISGGTGGFPGLALALAALVVINLAWATGWVPGQRHR